jgi:hypothetical protein
MGTARGIGVRSTETEGLGPEGAEPGHEVTRPDTTSRAQEERKPLSEEQIDRVIESHAGGCEWSDDEYASAVLLIRATERAHGITSPDAQEAQTL